VTVKLDKQLKGVTSMEEQQTRKLREDLSRNIEATRQDVEATRRNLEATRRDFEEQLAAVETRIRRADGVNSGANADKVKPPKFDGSYPGRCFIASSKLLLTIMTGRLEKRPLIL
jgi:hypothetical protein